MGVLRTIDVFNGDADGLIARHQFRLSFPAAPQAPTLVSGVKRDIALMDRVMAESGLSGVGTIQVFDISFDRNARAIKGLLDIGIHITYFDHHRASRLQAHPGLTAHIDQSVDVCTSLLVDRHCEGAHRLWAIAAAFGDNLSAVAQRLCVEANLSTQRIEDLKRLGECLNYNAYGETIEDLHYPPVDLAARLAPFASPFDFIEQEDVLSSLQAGFDADLASALATKAIHESRAARVYLLPNQSWTRRISGTFANHLVHASPTHAHAVLTLARAGDQSVATVSIRAPQSMPRDAARVAENFANGGGRDIAAGIESFPVAQLPQLIAMLEDTYRQ